MTKYHSHLQRFFRKILHVGESDILSLFTYRWDQVDIQAIVSETDLTLIKNPSGFYSGYQLGHHESLKDLTLPHSDFSDKISAFAEILSEKTLWMRPHPGISFRQNKMSKLISTIRVETEFWISTWTSYFFWKISLCLKVISSDKYSASDKISHLQNTYQKRPLWGRVISFRFLWCPSWYPHSVSRRSFGYKLWIFSWYIAWKWSHSPPQRFFWQNFCTCRNFVRKYRCGGEWYLLGIFSEKIKTLITTIHVETDCGYQLGCHIFSERYHSAWKWISSDKYSASDKISHLQNTYQKRSLFRQSDIFQIFMMSKLISTMVSQTDFWLTSYVGHLIYCLKDISLHL